MIGKGLTAVLLSLGILVTPTSPSPSVSAQSAPPERAVTACVREQQSLSVLFLVDSSQSLQGTDPNGQRVVGLNAAVDALGTIAQQASTEGGVPPAVFVEFADFGTTTRRAFSERPLWAPLTEPRGQLAGQIEQFRQRNRSEDTDYVGALDPWRDRAAPERPADEQGALELLEAAPEGSCRLLLWFTDGRFDIDYQGTRKYVNWTSEPLEIASEGIEEEAERRGVERLCQPGGLADQLRSGPITTGAGAYMTVVALGDPSNFGLVRAIAENTGAEVCGQEPARGDVLEAASLGELIYALATGPNPNESVVLGDMVPTCTSVELTDASVVSACELPFELTAAIRSFNLLTLAGDPAVSTVLVPPNGEAIRLSGSQALALANGVTLDIHQLGNAGDVFQVAGDLPGDGSWAGIWRLRFVSPDEFLARDAVNRASMYLFVRSLTARLNDADTELRVGRSRSISVQLVNPSDEPATDTSFVSGSEIDVFANGQRVDLSPIQPDGTFSFDFDVPIDFPGEELVVTAELRPIVRMNESAPIVELPQWSGELGRIAILPIPKHPIVDPFAPFIGALKQSVTTLTTTALVDASAPESGGCVRVSGVAVPDGGLLEGSPTVTLRWKGNVIGPSDVCPISLADGETGEIELEVSLEGAMIVDSTETLIVGEVSFEASGAIEPIQSGDVTNGYSTKVEPESSDVTEEGALWGLVAVALLIPLLLLFGANVIAARLRAGQSAHVVRRVRFTNGRFVDEADGLPVVFVSDDIDNIGNPQPGTHRELTIDNFKFDAKMPKNPFGDVSAVVTSPGSPFVVGDTGTAKKPRIGRTPVVMARAWAFAADGLPTRTAVGADTIEPLPGTLLIVTPAVHMNALPYIRERMPEIHDTVDRAIARHIVDPGVEPEPEPASVPGSAPADPGPADPFGGDTKPQRSGGTTVTDEAARGEPKDPFAGLGASTSHNEPAFGTPEPKKRSRKSTREKRPKRSRRSKDDSTFGGFPDDSSFGGSLPDEPKSPF